MIGGDGNDTYVVDTTTDTIVETSSGGTADTIVSSVDFDMSLIDNIERIKASGSNDIDLTGNSLNNYLNGNSGDNVLTGNDGNDRLYGFFGNDTLIGGEGRDQFIFSTTLNEISNVDTLNDFTSGTDRIMIDDNIFTSFSYTGQMVNSGNVVFSLGSTSNHSDTRIIYDKINGDLYYDGDGNGSSYNQIKFAELTPDTNLEYTDIYII